MNSLCEFSYSVRIWENTDQKKLRIWTLFTQSFFLKSESASTNINIYKLIF